MKNIVRFFAGLSLLLIVLFACGGGGDGKNEPELIAVEGVTLSQQTLAMKVGEQQTLKAQVVPSNATDKTVKWSSSKTSVATVSASGTVMAIAEGEAEITATAGGKKAKCIVTVKTDVVSVESVSLLEESLTLEEGATATLTATVLPADATDKTVTWSSSNSDVATVSDAGVVTAVKEGSATITAAAGGKQAKCTVTVKKGVVSVTGITLSQTSLSLEEGKTAALTATVQPSDATDKTVAWRSSDKAVATVSSSGVVTAVKEGSATITASAGGKQAQCTVTVKKGVVAVTGITLSQTSLSLEEGKTATLTATVQPSDATDKTVAWSSSDSGVATVSSSGVVTAVKEGSATITASAGGKQAKCTVTVKAKKESGMDAGINPWDGDDEDYGGSVN